MVKVKKVNQDDINLSVKRMYDEAEKKNKRLEKKILEKNNEQDHNEIIDQINKKKH